ncbi:sterol desaturase family protein [Desulfuromonas sp. KJ2020]|uniref:sterol desaturase family protein n=1 Tax=Desulfuromonas sp. KJ2020 TaxID=2919173 RepID=UPI0020A7BC66|nr:sterol desaturase family protein [Desulfuromonas sp. KJ2020]MCP3176232.1 sterol desaturase family protein [Desulfuromonas sp. KJ2020]
MWAPLLSIAVIGICIIALFLLERAFPLRQAKRALAGRLTVNLTYGIIAFATVSLIVRPVAEGTLGWTSINGFGLTRLEVIPDALRPIAAFLLMDLTFYWWHRANHRLPLLWRLHNVHHFDPDLDMSTTFRFHFGELAFSSTFRMVQLGLIGPSLATYLVYEVIFQLGTLFHHSNLRLPIRVERILVRLIVTPRMHGIHHSQIKEETNANYSSVFSCWDRLHHTVRLNVPQEAINIGIPGYAEPQDNHLGNSLLAPFRLQRDYWLRKDGHMPLRTETTGKLGQLAP